MAIVLQQRGSVTVAACDCCDRFCSAEGGSVVHARHCDSGLKSERWTPAPSSVEAPAAVAADSRTYGEKQDAYHAVNSVNPKDWNRAMNRDD